MIEAGDWAIIGVVILGGFVRGITGFGGAMVMAPPLSMLLDPVKTVFFVLFLETAAAVVMFRDALPKIRKPLLASLLIPAAFTVPLGGFVLVTLEPETARKIISAVVLICSAALLMGVRFNVTPRPLISIPLGGLVGVLLGATGIGAPPVILYLLSSPDTLSVTRANLTVFVTTISVLGLIMLVINGAVGWGLVRDTALLLGPYLIATWAGGLLYGRIPEDGLRRFVFVFLLMIGAWGVLR